MPDHYIYAVVGPSGVGKTTLTRELASRRDDLREVVSLTTRAPRAGEVEGVDYVFISREQAEDYIATDAYLEYAEYHGNIYGNLKSDFDDDENDLIIVIERHGMQQLIEAFGDRVVTILVVPPSLGELRSRLEEGRRTPEEIEKRLTTAQAEIDDREGFDMVMMNDDLEVALQDLEDLMEYRFFEDYTYPEPEEEFGEAEKIRLVTYAIRKADRQFQETGGSSRHWVQECFLPALDEVGLDFIKKD